MCIRFIMWYCRSNIWSNTTLGDIMKQKLEGVFSKSLRDRADLWYLKLQVNPLAHTKSPADFIILSDFHKNTYLVECKQVDLRKNPKNRYTFDRLTQEHDLWLFSRNFGESYVCILFLEKTLKKSHFYMIPIHQYLKAKRLCTKKSLNFSDMETYFQEFKLSVLKGSIVDLEPWIQ